ncbi:MULTISPECIES: HNH endonuclease [Pantoea]|uniref:HNH endonuclease n=1 Tax=Candidatus Pantoea gossypiicola TaxID=2608008 RepID=A0AB34CQC3_9GAMM|nr:MULTISPECIES: HNH endonuclease [Pantoea]KAA5961019.1 HNH endonuclease [Pantoea sp. VH_24]KAA5964440.1 HNH endonuclease [Pantoea sp. VH_16]KAA5968622.1 HNH endonuclease [Pantoea sp. VH_18]KAA6004311.1 HNH endonuclease [Pantoea sp. M_1]KAA6006795.1 HNH endonuclease [Pantoea sp. F_7]
MAKLKTLQPRLKAIDTRRIKPVYGEARRISGSTRMNLKRRIYVRDSGHCCMCQRVVDLHSSELDHRIALQFGGSNNEDNLWTLCIECHRDKSLREVASGQPDSEALKHHVPAEDIGASVTIV